MRKWPFITPVVMDLAAFSQYGGNPYTLTNTQIDSAFVTAEMWASNYINTPLVDTSVQIPSSPFEEDIVDVFSNREHNYFIIPSWLGITVLDSVKVMHYDGTPANDITTSCFVRDGRDIVIKNTEISLCTSRTDYFLRVRYHAGLGAGVARNNHFVMMALVKAVQMLINDLYLPATLPEQSTAQVVSFATGNYSQAIKPSPDTSFGRSQAAMQIQEYLDASGLRIPYPVVAKWG